MKTKQNNFDSKEFLDVLAADLMRSVENSSYATTPGLVGNARESEIRERLEKILPGGVGVGTGCVISSDGSVSLQQDIILYEKHICPIFSVSNSKEAHYYPCEGVIAVGEIKSSLGKKELLDSIEKVNSVKRLKRKEVTGSNISGESVKLFRGYLTRQSVSGTLNQEFNQKSKLIDQIYGFAICKNIAVKPNTLLKNLETKIEAIPENECPNIIISLDNVIVHPFSKEQGTLLLAGKNFVCGKHNQSSFSFLISRIYQIVANGRTCPLKSFEDYILFDRSIIKIEK